jgi:hypothetical protein
MAIKRFVAAVALVVATTMSAGAGAAEPVRCSLGGKYFVSSVKPFNTQEDAGYSIFTQLRGAEVYVPAQPGMTAEWLDRVVTYQIAAGECNFGVPKVNVEVLSDGGGFTVRLASMSDRYGNEREAGEILRHAQQLVKSP